MPDLLDPAVFRQMLAFLENPAPLLEAIRRYPFTLLHGDYRAENLAHNGKPVTVDWQQASCSLMTIDLAWSIKQGYIHEVMTREEVAAYYRARLEGYMKQPFEDRDSHAMLALGSAVDDLSSTCFPAYFYKVYENPDSRAWNSNQVIQQGQMVMDVLQWL